MAFAWNGLLLAVNTIIFAFLKIKLITFRTRWLPIEMTNNVQHYRSDPNTFRHYSTLIPSHWSLALIGNSYSKIYMV